MFDQKRASLENVNIHGVYRRQILISMLSEASIMDKVAKIFGTAWQVSVVLWRLVISAAGFTVATLGLAIKTCLMVLFIGVLYVLLSDAEYAALATIIQVDGLERILLSDTFRAVIASVWQLSLLVSFGYQLFLLAARNNIGFAAPANLRGFGKGAVK